MPKSTTSAVCETPMSRPRHPVVSYLGGISRSASGAGGRLSLATRIRLSWVRYRFHRRASKNAGTRQDAFSPGSRPHGLDKAVRLRMLAAMPGWFFDQRSKAFVPNSDAPELLEELLDAVTDLRSETVVLRISGISSAEASRVRGYLQKGSDVVVVNHRSCEPAFG